jgi:hypothetical protein
MEVDGSTNSMYDLALVPAFLGRDLYCLSAVYCVVVVPIREQLCSPGESNSGLKVLPDHQATPYPTHLPAPYWEWSQSK